MLNTSYALVNHEQIVMQNNKKKSTLHLKKHVNYIFFKFVLPGSRVNSLLGGGGVLTGNQIYNKSTQKWIYGKFYEFKMALLWIM